MPFDSYETTTIKILNRLAQTAGWPLSWEPRFVIPDGYPGAPSLYYSGGFREIAVTLPLDRHRRRCDEARHIIAAMRNPPRIAQGYALAAYLPADDEVILPDRRLFHCEEGFYATVFHELAHATSHKSRLDRAAAAMNFEESADPPERDRAGEEIVAELAAAFLCDRAGILDPVIGNVADYLRKWAAILDPENLTCPVVDAAREAREAAACILGRDAG